MRVSISSIRTERRFRRLNGRVTFRGAAGRWRVLARVIGLAGTLVLTARCAAAADAHPAPGPAIAHAETHTPPAEAHAGGALSDDADASAAAVIQELRSFERTLAPSERIQSFSIWCLFLLALFLGRKAIVRLWGSCQKAPPKRMEAAPQRKAAPKPAAPPKSPPTRTEFYRHGSTIVARRP